MIPGDLISKKQARRFSTGILGLLEWTGPDEGYFLNWEKNFRISH